MDNIFALLLVCLAGTWSGGREAYEFAEGFRGVLVTTSRRCRLLDGRPITLENETRDGCSVLDQIWYSWIEAEKRKRLGMAIYVSPHRSGLEYSDTASFMIVNIQVCSIINLISAKRRQQTAFSLAHGYTGKRALVFHGKCSLDQPICLRRHSTSTR